MLNYNVEYELNGVKAWAKVRAYSSSSARMIIENRYPGCQVLYILPDADPRGR